MSQVAAPLPQTSRLKDAYAGTLKDLGDLVSTDFRDIYRDPQAFDPAMFGVTDQFTSGAAEYSAKFDNVANYTDKLTEAFGKIGWKEFNAPVQILDIGVGSGSSTYVLLRMFPKANIVACDISAEMLQLTRRRLAEHEGMLERCLTIQMDSEKLLFKEESFDLVVGAANLHHLFHPDQTIKQAGKILKPGGHAIFFDPFEPGNAMVGLICRQVCEKLRVWQKKNPLVHMSRWAMRRESAPRFSGGITNRLKQFTRWVTRRDGITPLLQYLDNFAHVIAIMARRDKSAPEFQKLDDKWLFTKAYFNQAADEAGFSKTWIYPLHATEKPLENHIRYLLEQAGHLDHLMPDWGWEMFQQYDRTFSDDLKKDMLIEGCVILRK